MNPTSKVFADFFKDETPLHGKVELLMDKMLEGHICLDLSEEETNTLSKSRFVYKGVEKQPFVVENNFLYLQRYFEYEMSIVKSIEALVAYSKSQIPKIQEELKAKATFVQALFSEQSKEIDWQLIAGLNACLYNFAIITGGPGTGKTTTVSKLICLLSVLQPDMKVILAAPTGKAAMRMKESLESSLNHLEVDDSMKAKLKEIKSLTIHRLLGTVRDSPYFVHNASNPLPYDLVVIDEASMIDIPTMAKLLEAVRPSSKIIFLGDKNQLASVEVGSVFGDLCGTIAKINSFDESNIQFFFSFIKQKDVNLSQLPLSEETHFLSGTVVELQKSRRFDAENGIGFFSKSIIEGKNIQIKDWVLLSAEKQKGVGFYSELQEIAQDVLAYSEYIREVDVRTALSKVNKIRVLCATREGNFGLKQCNLFIEKVLKDASLVQPETGFYHNQLIMITSNDNGLKIFNGDVGIVRREEGSQILKVYFEDLSNDNGLRVIPTSYIKNYETAFAMTIHKSQGSEFETAIVVMPDAKIPILTRELLYTAVTRAKMEARVVIKQEVLDFAIGQQVKRSSGIVKRIKKWA